MKISLNDTHFEILGLTRYCTKEEIKKAYRKKIKTWHPDKFPNQPDKILEALEKSKIINEAFSLLANYQPPSQEYTTSNTSTFYRTNTQSNYKQTQPKPKNSRLNIERIRVKSSNIHSIGYDSEFQILQIEFLNGSIYQYYDVPKYVYNELMQATSKGKYLNSKVFLAYKYNSV